MRRASRKDANHNEITSVFRKCGFLVHDASAMGRGFPDVILCRAGVLTLVEIKDGRKPPSARVLTPAQVKFRKEWPVYVVTNTEDALALVTRLTPAKPPRKLDSGINGYTEH